MKRFIICIASFFLFTAFSWATDVRLEWDEIPDNEVIGYVVYRAQMSGVTSAPFMKVADVPGRETTIYVDTVDDATDWVWVVTARNAGGLESGPSNITQLYELTLPIPPRNLRRDIN